MQVSNVSQPTLLDNTSGYFNNYYDTGFDVSSELDTAVIGYFEKIADNSQSAKIMAGSLIYTAKAQGIDPMELIRQLSKSTPVQLTNYLTMFLNLNRVGTSYLGLTNIPPTSKYISRAVLP